MGGWGGGGWTVRKSDNKANSVQLLLQLATGTEIGKIGRCVLWGRNKIIVKTLISYANAKICNAIKIATHFTDTNVFSPQSIKELSLQSHYCQMYPQRCYF